MYMSYWKNGLSVDESKFSILIILLLVFSGLAIHSYITIGDFSTNLLQLIGIFTTGIVGINVSDMIFSKKEVKYEENESNPTI